MSLKAASFVSVQQSSSRRLVDPFHSKLPSRRETHWCIGSNDAACGRTTGSSRAVAKPARISERVSTLASSINGFRMIDLNPSAYGTHSLRRTKVALIYKKTGNLRACQLLLGHGKLESTVRYLGIEVDDALEISEQIDL